MFCSAGPHRDRFLTRQVYRPYLSIWKATLKNEIQLKPVPEIRSWIQRESWKLGRLFYNKLKDFFEQPLLLIMILLKTKLK